MNEWDGIEGFEAWRSKLQSLLQEANRLARGNDDEARFKMARRLTEFVENSRPQNDDMNRLDQIAGDTAVSLMQITIEQRLASLTERAVELARLTKEIDARAGAALASAEAIRLTRARSAVDALTRSVNALVDLRAALDNVSETDLADSVEGLIALIQEVRSAIENPPASRSAGAGSRAISRRGNRPVR